MGGRERGGERRSWTLITVAAALLIMAAGIALAEQPELTLAGLDGEKLHEAELLKQTALVVVWASWSPHCREVPSQVAELSRHWGSKARVLTLDFEEDAHTVRSFLAKTPMHAPVFLDADGAFSKKYGVTSLPGLIVFKDGKAVYNGRFPDDPKAVLNPILH